MEVHPNKESKTAANFLRKCINPLKSDQKKIKKKNSQSQQNLA
jgi:hypothetical protein